MTARRDRVMCDGVGRPPVEVTEMLGDRRHRGVCPVCRQAARIGVDGMLFHTRPVSLVQARRNRETGTLIEIHDLDVPGAPLERGDGQGTPEDREHRWLTLCDEHGIICTHPTLTLARYHAGQPSTWCGVCRGDETDDPECED